MSPLGVNHAKKLLHNPNRDKKKNYGSKIRKRAKTKGVENAITKTANFQN
jgi:hypothetical protein